MHNAPSPNVGPVLGTAVAIASNAQINALYSLLDNVKKLQALLNSPEVPTVANGSMPVPQNCATASSFRAHPDEHNGGLLPELLRDSLRQAELIENVQQVVDDLLKIFG